MNLLVAYTNKNTELTLTGVYSEEYSLERKNDYVPQRRSTTLEEIQNFFLESPVTFAKVFKTSVNTDMSEEDFLQIFHKKLQLTVAEYGDEKTITSLSIGREE